jgi:hypothetical protein
MNEQQATGRTDVDVFPAAVAQEVEIDPDTNTFFAVVGYLEAEDYIDPSPNATLVGATVFRITARGMAWLETPPGVASGSLRRSSNRTSCRSRRAREGPTAQSMCSGPSIHRTAGSREGGSAQFVSIAFSKVRLK